MPLRLPRLAAGVVRNGGDRRPAASPPGSRPRRDRRRGGGERRSGRHPARRLSPAVVLDPHLDRRGRQPPTAGASPGTRAADLLVPAAARHAPRRLPQGRAGVGRTHAGAGARGPARGALSDRGLVVRGRDRAGGGGEAGPVRPRGRAAGDDRHAAFPSSGRCDGAAASGAARCTRASVGWTSFSS